MSQFDTTNAIINFDRGIGSGSESGSGGGNVGPTGPTGAGASSIVITAGNSNITVTGTSNVQISGTLTTLTNTVNGNNQLIHTLKGGIKGGLSNYVITGTNIFNIAKTDSTELFTVDANANVQIGPTGSTGIINMNSADMNLNGTNLFFGGSASVVANSPSIIMNSGAGSFSAGDTSELANGTILILNDATRTIKAIASDGMDLETRKGYFNAGDTTNVGNKTQINLLDAGGITGGVGYINLNTNTGKVGLGDINSINTGYQFEANAGSRYLTSNGGRMANHSEYTSPNTKIEIYDNFITTDVPVDLQRVEVYTNPLLTSLRTGPGWFCYIQNISGGSITISSLDSTNFVSSGVGFFTHFALNAYTTARFTLTYWTTNGSYYWSVLVG